MTQPVMPSTDIQNFEKFLNSMDEYLDALCDWRGEKQKKRYRISPAKRQYFIDTWLPVLYVYLPGMSQSFVDRPDLVEHIQRITIAIRAIFEEQICARGMQSLIALMPLAAMMEQHRDPKP